MKRRITAYVGTVVLAVVGLVAMAGVAQATERDGVCERGELCMWQHNDRRGGGYDAYNSIPDFRRWSFVRGCESDCSLDNNVTSLQNYDPTNSVRLFEHENMRGLYFWRQKANAGTSDEAMNLTLDRDQNGDDWNDRFGSFCFVYDGSPYARCHPA